MKVRNSKLSRAKKIKSDLKQLLFFLGLLLVLGMVAAFSSPRINLPKPETVPTQTSIPDVVVPVSNQEISKANVSRNEIVFTFDGGSTDISTLKVLDVLEKHNIKGTFFLTGDFIEKYSDTVLLINAEGHEIYNHTYSHPYLTQIADQQIKEELNKTDEALKSLVGKSTKPYFRPPYGDRNERVRTVAAQNGYQSVYWTHDAMDWKESEGMTEWEVKNIILNNAAAGNIYLMHLGDNITGNVLDEVFLKLKDRGFNLVSLGQTLKR